MTAKQAAVKRYVVKLSDDERERLDTLIHAGKHSARLLTKARILLKADAAEAGEGWSDSQIAAALDTSIDTVARTRQQLVEEGFEAVLVRKHSPASARPRIFDGAAEAKLIALACSRPPKGRKRWTLQLLEEAVVELNIVERASDNTIGRTLKKTRSNPICKEQWLDILERAASGYLEGARDPKQSRSRRRQLDLLEAATRVFAREGIAKAKMADIAAEAGMSVSSIR